MRIKTYVSVALLGIAAAGPFSACMSTKHKCEDFLECDAPKGGASGGGGESGVVVGGSGGATTTIGGGVGVGGSGGGTVIGSSTGCGAVCGGATPICDAVSKQCVACASDAHCGGVTPVCDLVKHQCVGCTSSASCLTAPRNVCDASTASCVECIGPDHCKDPTKSVCKGETKTCVECLVNPDCSGKTTLQGVAGAQGTAGASGFAGAAGAPSSTTTQSRAVCDTSTNTCVGCMENTDCTGTPSTPLCNKEKKQCVACLTNTDCTNAGASRCDLATNTCVMCAADNDCTQIAGKKVCAAAWVGQPNRCVECTGQRYDTCGKLGEKPLVCDSQTSTCSTDKTKESTGPCQPCISDAQCKPGQLCAKQMFGGKSVGHFCFWKQGDAASGGIADCTVESNRPYVKADSSAVSIDNTSATLCMLRQSTCIALNQFSSTSCQTPTGPSDEQCGFAPGEDSKCVPFGTTGSLCTTTCISDYDCLGSSTTSGIKCDLNATPRVCTLQ